jgi:hypothetical protein
MSLFFGNTASICLGGRIETRRETMVGRDQKPELYLSQDILQGEDVPFYLLWSGLKIDDIDIKFSGFESISTLHNVHDPDKAIQRNIIGLSDLKTPGYLGGILTTKIVEDPLAKASLELSVKLSDGSSLLLKEERMLHTTRVEIENVPDSIHIPLRKKDPRIEVRLVGSATVMISVESLEDSEIALVLPSEVLNAVEKFTEAVVDGFEDLREEFPEHSGVIDAFIEVDENTSMRQYVDGVVVSLQEVKEDTSFIEALSMMFVGAMLGQASVRDSLFLPLAEYLDSVVAGKAYLESPFLSAKIPPEGGRLACQLTVVDLRKNQCGPPKTISTVLSSEEEEVVPLKELIKIRRA